MKRLYIAILLIIIGISLGIVEKYTIKHVVNNCVESIDKAESMINNKEFKNARRICNKAALEFDDTSRNVLFYYYSHNQLNNISNSIYQLSEYINKDQIGDYKALKAQIKKQLQSLEEEELLRAQNIL